MSNNAKIIGGVILLVIGLWYLSTLEVNVPAPNIPEPVTDTLPATAADYETEALAKANLIRVDNLSLGEVVSSPLTITGEARGNWFFEASFPVYITDWNGLIIGEGYATAGTDWMTEDFAAFSATITFTSPYTLDSPDFMQYGTVILKKDNPSGLPEHDDALEFGIIFSPQ